MARKLGGGKEYEHLVNVTFKNRMPTKLQHYLPVFYLKHFLDRDGKTFLVYDKEHLSVARRTPATTGAETHLYTAMDLSGKANDIMETGFLQRIDSFGKPLLDLVRNEEPLTPEDQQRLALFIAVMHLRVPRQIQTAKEVGEAVVEHHLKKRVSDQDVEEIAAKIGSTPDDVRRLMDDPTRYSHISGDRTAAMLTSLDACWKLADELFSMPCRIMRLDKPKLITGDAPVVITAAEGLLTRPGGIREHGAEVTFVIDPKTCVYYSRAEKEMLKHSRQLNQRIAWYAERYIIASKRSKETLALVKEAAETRRLPKIDKAEVFKGLDEMDERDRQKGADKP